MQPPQTQPMFGKGTPLPKPNPLGVYGVSSVVPLHS